MLEVCNASNERRVTLVRAQTVEPHSPMTQPATTTPAPALPGPGDVVAGKYRIDGTLGVGGMGVVMAAMDSSLGRAVAIKFLSRARVDRPDAVARFQREARAAAALQGENVVRILEVSQLPSGEPFIVMEYLRGTDLSHVVHERGGLPVAEATEYILQACEGLAEAHGRGIVHRDLKPQNLFRTEQPDGSALVKILDFGISKALEEGSGTSDLTRTDTVLGTPLYMSPEQIRSLKNVDHRADVWALGIILFELLTATPAFVAPSASALCAMIVVDPPLRLSERRPGAPAEIEGIILRCLEKDPARRYQDVAALAAALRPFTTDRGRLSADRVLSSAPLRAAFGPTGPPAIDPSLAPTVQAGDPLALGPRAGATDPVWTAGHPTAAPPSRGASGVGVAGTVAVIVGAALTGVILLGAATGTFLYLRGRAPTVAAPTAPPAHSVAEPSRSVTVATADTSMPVAPGGARVVTVVASATVPSPPAPPRTTPSAPRPGTSASAAKPGASALAERQRIERKHQSDAHVMISRNWAQTGDWRAAKMAVCPSANRPGGTNAERAQCRVVCTKLDDNMCLMEIDGADRQWPATL